MDGLREQFNKQLIHAVAKEVGLSSTQMNKITSYFPKGKGAMDMVTTTGWGEKRRLLQRDIKDVTKTSIKIQKFLITLLRSIQNDQVSGYNSVCVLGKKGYQLSGPKPKEYVLTPPSVVRDQVKIRVGVPQHHEPEVPAHTSMPTPPPTAPIIPTGYDYGRLPPPPTKKMGHYYGPQPVTFEDLKNTPKWVQNLAMLLPFMFAL